MIVDVDSAAKKQLVLIATCHVHWDPEFCDVKLIQTMMFMHRLQNIIKEAQTALLPPSSSSDCNQIPVILCGDLNSLPESGMLCLLIVFCYCATFNLSHCTWSLLNCFQRAPNLHRVGLVIPVVCERGKNQLTVNHIVNTLRADYNCSSMLMMMLSSGWKPVTTTLPK